jgi:hypothetical protein
VWALVALTGAVAAGTALALGRVRARNVEEPHHAAVDAAPVPPTAPSAVAPPSATQGGRG